jgi:putative transposase
VRCWSLMSRILIWLEAFKHCGRTAHRVLADLVELLLLATMSRGALAAENLFLRKQLALFQERNARPHQAEDSARWLMARLSRLFDWRSPLVVVKPDTLIRWHRRGFRMPRARSLWCGKPRLARMDSLSTKLAICTPPRVVRENASAAPIRPDSQALAILGGVLIRKSVV